jgi:hypothetical protein
MNSKSLLFEIIFMTVITVVRAQSSETNNEAVPFDSLTYSFSKACVVKVLYADSKKISEQIAQLLEKKGLRQSNNARLQIWIELTENNTIYQETNEYSPYRGEGGYKHVLGPSHGVSSIKNREEITELFSVKVYDLQKKLFIDSAGYEHRYTQSVSDKARIKFAMKRIKKKIDILKLSF